MSNHELVAAYPMSDGPLLVVVDREGAAYLVVDAEAGAAAAAGVDVEAEAGAAAAADVGVTGSCGVWGGGGCWMTMVVPVVGAVGGTG